MFDERVEGRGRGENAFESGLGRRERVYREEYSGAALIATDRVKLPLNMNFF